MDTLAPALAIVFEILTVLTRVALGIVAAIAIAYYIYLFTYYKKHLERGIGIRTSEKAKKASIIFGACIVLILVGAFVFPILQGVYAARVV